MKYRPQARVDMPPSKYLVRQDRYSRAFNAMRYNLYLILDDGHLVEDGFTHTNDGIEAAIDRLFGHGHDEIEVVSIT